MRRLLLFAVVAFLAACSTIDCPVQNKVAVNYTVMSYKNGVEVADTLKDTLYIWTTRIDGKDTLLYNRGVNTKSFSLPLSYAHPEDTLVFCVVDTNKVVKIDHDRIRPCGTRS